MNWWNSHENHLKQAYIAILLYIILYEEMYCFYILHVEVVTITPIKPLEPEIFCKSSISILIFSMNYPFILKLFAIDGMDKVLG